MNAIIIKVIKLKIFMAKRPPRYLICNGDANSYITHGGLPFSLFKEASNQGLLDYAVSLNYRKLKLWKYLWNTLQFLKFGKPGGFQYSKFYVKKLINEFDISSENEKSILSIYPMLPSYPWPKNWDVDFYIDYTTLQIFNEYSPSKLISESYKNIIIKRERLNYLNAIECSL